LAVFGLDVAAGLGVLVVYLALLTLTVALVGASAFVFLRYVVPALAPAWLVFVVLAATPVTIFVWWACFGVSLLLLDATGVELGSRGSWAALPVAPVLASSLAVLRGVAHLGRSAPAALRKVGYAIAIVGLAALAVFAVLTVV
jgi:hypothetical protein